MRKFAIITSIVLAGCTGLQPKGKPTMKTPARIVVVGDSITDGHTYPLLIQQALREAGVRPPVVINAGIGGDTAAGMRKRMERDVFPHSPDLVTLSAGINDANLGVKPEDYERDVVAIIDQAKAKGIPMLLFTTSIVSDKLTDAQQRLTQYNAALRRLAEANGYKVAEVGERMQAAAKAGEEVLEQDGIHLSFAGYRAMTRAILDALGHTGAPVPKEMKLALMPGVIRDWKFRAVADDKTPRLDAEAARALPAESSGWVAYSLPETVPGPNWWFDQERQRGFAIALAGKVGKAQRFIGLASVESRAKRRAFINTGASLQSVWLNGEKVYQQGGAWVGWHAGRERIPVVLQAGPNTLVIETGPQFFLSVTDDNRW